MGWRSFDKKGNIKSEDKDGRPVQLGEEGKLVAIEQIDYGHKVAIDLRVGVIYLDYDEPLGVQNGTLELSNPKAVLWIAEDTTPVGDMFHVRQEFVKARDPKTKLIAKHPETGRPYKVRNDILTALTWRPIWFSRVINGIPVKIIGAQVTLPDLQGGGNCQKMVMLYPDGRVGIS